MSHVYSYPKQNKENSKCQEHRTDQSNHQLLQETPCKLVRRNLVPSYGKGAMECIANNENINWSLLSRVS